MTGQRVVSKRVETEAMQWRPESSATENRADVIVAWVNANGGEARYEPEIYAGTAYDEGTPARIMVRTNSEWAPVAPGWWIIMGSETFMIAPDGLDPTLDDIHEAREVLDHYPCDPDTFAKRWDVKA